MVPADQSLDAADLVAAEIDDGLVVELELAGGERPAQVALHDAPRLHLRVHLRPEVAIGAAPVLLCAVECQVRAADELIGLVAIRGADGDADARADDHLLVVDVVGRADRLDDAQRQGGGIRWLADADLENGELVSAHAGDRVRLPHQPPQTPRHQLQELVAGCMAERIVHALEVVEIDEVNRQHLVPPDARQSLLEALVEQHAVGQVRQRIVQRHVHDLGFRAALRRDVLVREDPPAVRHLPLGYVDDAAVGELHHLRVDGAVLGETIVREPIRLVGRIAARAQPVLQDLAHGGAGLHLLEDSPYMSA